ncbi:MAG: DnaJ family molecular chaperone [Fimbriimonadaceae bacterium]|nr:DnaJ family molecular chaperone [Alphaproteobacteria bacterium]
MSVWGKIGGAAAGFAIGGPLGALIGAVAGHLVDKLDTSAIGSSRDEVAFTIGVIALGAKMAKADGVVTRDEVEAFKQVFQVPDSEIRNVARLFDLAKQDVAGFEAYASQLARLFRDRMQTLESVVDGLFHIAKADGVLHPSELEFLKAVAGIFGFDDDGFARIKARHLGPDLADPYVILGLERSASPEQIKKAYRQLVRENHPDKLIAQGLPEEFIRIATEKLARINQAFDRIEKERAL